jgi:IstB-like ATP binding protein
MTERSARHAEGRKAQLAAGIRQNEHVRAPHRWGEVFGDDVVAAAMIDRLVHHAEVVALKGDSYRLKDRDLGRVPAAGTTEE